MIAANPEQLASYLSGKEAVAQWFFGQVMAAAKGQANPKVVREALKRRLDALKSSSGL